VNGAGRTAVLGGVVSTAGLKSLQEALGTSVVIAAAAGPAGAPLPSLPTTLPPRRVELLPPDAVPAGGSDRVVPVSSSGGGGGGGGAQPVARIPRRTVLVVSGSRVGTTAGGGRRF